MGASPGNFGTIRAQLALRRTFLFTESYIVLKPELHVFDAADRFNVQGTLIDETMQGMVRGLLVELISRARRLNPI
ncbi:MAG: hypothetical protein ACRDIE_01395 [Chloroflexota bacterium]